MEAEASESHFVRMIDREAVRKSRAKTEKYKWNGRLRPSDIASFRDCPKKLVEGRQTKGWTPSKKLNAQFDMGDMVHRYLQERARKTPGLKPPDPEVPDWLKKELYEDKEGDEIPVGFLGKSGNLLMVGFIDCQQLKYGALSLVEFKTRNNPAEDFNARFEKVIVLNKHKIQLKIYQYLERKMGYWPDLKRTDGELIYTCLDIMNGDDKRHRSVWVPLTTEDIKMLDAMFEEIEVQILATGFYGGATEDVPCTYPYCRDHGKE
jgi:hypothetical protein